jgi:hypothetical protein
LSTSILQELKNKFPFFPCQARKPYGHKAFPRFHAREIIGKNFPASVIFRRSMTRESKAKDCQRVRNGGKDKDESQAERTRTAREGKERKEGNQSRLLETYCHSPLNIHNKREARAVYQVLSFQGASLIRIV